MYGLERLTYLCLKGDTHTDFYTAFATEELRATPPTVLCSVSLSITVYTKTRNPAALVFIPICAGRRAGMRIFMAGSTTNINIQMDSDLKAQADALFGELGMDLSTAFNIFVRQALREGRIPFNISLNQPNKETIAAMSEAERIAKDPSVKSYTDLDELFADLKS